MRTHNPSVMSLKLRSSRSDSNRRLRATVGQNSSSFQMASACHMCAAVLVHVARRRRLESDLDERSLNDNSYQIPHSESVEVFLQLGFYTSYYEAPLSRIRINAFSFRYGQSNGSTCSEQLYVKE